MKAIWKATQQSNLVSRFAQYSLLLLDVRRSKYKEKIFIGFD